MREGHWKLNIGKIRFSLMHGNHVRALGAGEMCVCERLRERKREECMSNNNEYCSTVETTSVFLSLCSGGFRCLLLYKTFCFERTSQAE